jgi:hypothetical protein
VKPDDRDEATADTIAATLTNESILTFDLEYAILS